MHAGRTHGPLIPEVIGFKLSGGFLQFDRYRSVADCHENAEEEGGSRQVRRIFRRRGGKPSGSRQGHLRQHVPEYAVRHAPYSR